VIHVSGHKQINPKAIRSNDNGLTEQVILYKNKKGTVGRIVNHVEWRKLFRQAVNDYILKMGKPDLVHVHIPMKAGLIALWIKKKFDIPYIITEHWGMYNEVLSGNYNSRPAWFKRISKRIFLNARGWSSVSQYLADRIGEYVLSGLNFKIIHNVVDTSLFYSVEKNGGKFRFIHVSNMVPLKDVQGILFAFANLIKEKDAELILVGSDEPGLQQLANTQGLLNKNVFFKGEVSYSTVATEMQKADCLVLFSIMENSPCVIGEALCCGIPIIATNVGGIPELVTTANSILVEPENPEQLTSAMKKIMNDYDKFNKKQIAEAAQSRFNYSVIGKQFDDLYSSIVIA
jgi:glycosyltransferase involved in cell wall biosynthesis